MCHTFKNAMIGLLCSSLANLLTFAVAYAGPMFYLHDNHGALATVNASTGKVSKIGSMGVVMTDIALDPSGNLFGISYNDFYRIDRRTAAATYVGKHNIPSANALTFAPDGKLFAAGAGSTKLYTVTPSTGRSTVHQEIGFASAGDLAFAPEGPVFDSAGKRIQYICGNPDLLYMTSTDGKLVSIGNSFLRSGSLQAVGELDGRSATTAANVRNPVLIDWPVSRPPGPTFGSSKVVGNLGVANMYGLVSGPNGELYGLAGNEIYAINKQTGSASILSSFAGQGLGQVFGASYICVPEPASLGLVAIAGLAVLVARSRARQQTSTLRYRTDSARSLRPFQARKK